MLKPLPALAALLLVPACHDDDDGRGGSVALMSDAFDRSDPGAEWSTGGGAGTVAIDPARGNPAPGLVVSAGQGATTAAAQTSAAFPARLLTLSADVEAVGPGQGVGGVAVVDDGGNVLASAERPFGAGGPLAFRIGGSGQTLPLPADEVQRLTFRVDAAGTASWSVNGDVVTSALGFPGGPVKMRLFHRIDGPIAGTSPGAFVFDNVVVTTP